MNSRADLYTWWNRAIAGEKVPVYESKPQCGYFRLRDRSGANKQLAPIKRPWIPAAIWVDDAGRYQAEINGRYVNPLTSWLWLAKHPISYDEYLELKKGKQDE